MAANAEELKNINTTEQTAVEAKMPEEKTEEET